MCPLGGVDARIDLVESLALADDRTFLEQPLQDHARNLRANVGHLGSGDSAGKLLLERGAALLDDDIADRGRASETAAPASSAAPAAGLRVTRTAAAGGERQHQGKDGTAPTDSETIWNHRCGQLILSVLIASPGRL